MIETHSRAMPAPLESETLALLSAFLRPLMENAGTWPELAGSLAERGYGLIFREGRLIIVNDAGHALCTSRCLGMPLRNLVERLGRPCIRAERDGRSGRLH